MLQWLDDVDDAVFAVVLVWERLRRVCLRLGAAAVLAACAAVSADWLLPLAALAGFGVIAAVLRAAFATLADGSAERA